VSELRLFGFVRESITDGPGLRAAVFVQGCPHRCEGCHNPGSHDFAGGYTAGTQDIFREIQRNPLLSGVTFTGGEPMCQPGPLTELAALSRSIGLDVAVYTGYTLEELLAEDDPARMALLAAADTLVDGRFLLKERSLELRFRGSANQRVLDARKSLDARAPVLQASERWL